MGNYTTNELIDKLKNPLTQRIYGVFDPDFKSNKPPEIIEISIKDINIVNWHGYMAFIWGFVYSYMVYFLKDYGVTWGFTKEEIHPHITQKELYVAPPKIDNILLQNLWRATQNE